MTDTRTRDLRRQVATTPAAIITASDPDALNDTDATAVGDRISTGRALLLILDR